MSLRGTNILLMLPSKTDTTRRFCAIRVPAHLPPNILASFARLWCASLYTFCSRGEYAFIGAVILVPAAIRAGVICAGALNVGGCSIAGPGRQSPALCGVSSYRRGRRFAETSRSIPEPSIDFLIGEQAILGKSTLVLSTRHDKLCVRSADCRNRREAESPCRPRD